MNWDFRLEPPEESEAWELQHSLSCECMTCEAEGPYAPDYDAIELEEAE